MVPMTLSSVHSAQVFATGTSVAGQRRDHLVLAVDGMGAGQQLAGWLPAHHVLAAAGTEHEGRDWIGRP
jgi:hypothetical protein